MAENRMQDHWEGENEKHLDTRHLNHECEKHDLHLGCNLGIVVAW